MELSDERYAKALALPGNNPRSGELLTGNIAGA